MCSAVLQDDLVNISKEEGPDLVRHMDSINAALFQMDIREEPNSLQHDLRQCHAEVLLKQASKRFFVIEDLVGKQLSEEALCITSHVPDSE